MNRLELVTSEGGRVAATGSSVYGSVALRVDDSAHHAVTVLSKRQAVVLASWLALGQGYLLTPDPSGEGRRARGVATDEAAS